MLEEDLRHSQATKYFPVHQRGATSYLVHPVKVKVVQSSNPGKRTWQAWVQVYNFTNRQIRGPTRNQNAAFSGDTSTTRTHLPLTIAQVHCTRERHRLCRKRARVAARINPKAVAPKCPSKTGWQKGRASTHYALLRCLCPPA